MKREIRIAMATLFVLSVALFAILKNENTAKNEFIPVVYKGIDKKALEENQVAFKRSKGGKEGGPDARAEFEFLKRKNPVTNEIPEGIRSAELRFAKSIDRAGSNLRQEASQQIDFLLRGPYNVGGRTRALAIDVTRDSTLVAGGISGGMWKSVDMGQNWVKTTSNDDIANASSIIQDPREGHTNVWYYGTGEVTGNSAGKSGAPYRGDGIWKSTDGADSWQVIPQTSSGTLSFFDSPFKYVNRLIINHLNENETELYAAVFGGIIRTVDDFQTYEFVLGSTELAGGRFTEIVQTESGVYYATISRESGDDEAGVYTSTDGINWTDITPFEDNFRFERVVIGVAESDEDSVYFHSSGNEYRLFLYTANNNTWLDLTDNLPSFGGSVGDLNQGSYNMFIKVHPLDASVVYIGSTNLYRSTDGFTSTENTSWVGGYSYENDVSLYENHHPDQHYLEFLSSDPNKMISSNDGGVQITLDNLKDTIDWITLNNGYVTSQFYSAGVNQQDPGDNRLVGGLQDNSCFYGFDTDPESDWQDIYGGDGAFTDITFNSILVSSQFGRMYRYGFNEDLENNSQGFIRPPGQQDGSVNYLFINPFTVDPVDPNRVYVAADGVVYYTPDVREYPNNNDWIEFSPSSSSILPDENVSAIGVSTTPAHVVYVGFTNGQLFKMPNGDDNNERMVEVTGDNFPVDGYINCVEVDEDDADRALAVFTNYEVLSVFLTEDGGETWTPVSGNLEENEDGSGNGIGINWAESITISDTEKMYFLGTNTGLYSTTVLDGMNTVWTKMSQDVIGNSVIDMIRVRSNDGYIVVGTHGNGMYEGYVDKAFTPTLSILGSTELCAGESVVLRAPRAENLTYQWFLDGEAIDGETNYNIEVTGTGSYSVQIDNAGTLSNSNIIDVFSYSRPSAEIFEGEGELFVEECTGCRYLWVDQFANTISEERVLNLSEVTVPSVRVIVSNNCFTSQSDRFDLITGLEDNKNVAIYPNPVVDQVEVLIKDSRSVEAVQLFDLNGRLIDQSTQLNENKATLDLSAEKGGLYLIKVQYGFKTESFKIFKK